MTLIRTFGDFGHVCELQYYSIRLCGDTKKIGILTTEGFHRFQMLDENKDGMLSWNEFRELHEKLKSKSHGSAAMRMQSCLFPGGVDNHLGRGRHVLASPSALVSTPPSLTSKRLL